jgi:hypothetical protein
MVFPREKSLSSLAYLPKESNRNLERLSKTSLKPYSSRNDNFILCGYLKKKKNSEVIMVLFFFSIF